MTGRAKSVHMVRRHLDEKVSKLQYLRGLPTPVAGWIKTTAEALGMSTRQLAARMGIDQSSVVRLQKGEREGTATLATIRRAAEALGCVFVYAILPQGRSHDAAVRKEAERVAQKLVDRVSHSMELEKQGVSKKTRDAQVKELADELYQTMSRDLWGEK